MREFKFRGWSNYSKTMKYFDRPEDMRSLVVMQSTGMRDKNGKEVYEGDILKYTRKIWQYWEDSESSLHYKDLVQICEIYWSSAHYAFRVKGDFGGRQAGRWSGYLSFHDERADENIIEVIGNIFENPELLEKKEWKVIKEDIMQKLYRENRPETYKYDVSDTAERKVEK